AVINPIVNGVLKGISRRVEASSFNLAEATGLKAASGTNTRGARYYRKSITISNQSFVDGNSELNAILSHPDFENIANEVLALSNYQAGHISEMQEVSGWLHLKDGKLRLASVDLDPRATHKSTYMKPAPKLKGGILVHFHTHPSVGIYYKHPTNGKSVATRLRPSDADITYAGDYGSGIIIGGNRKVLGYTPLY
ncbi:MAG: hypothetical protein JKY93_03770, partial [Gammaproteobacteria bacterium]|nr:hypothetical protein [Gammaproteobacteria bacterium]